MKSMQFGNIAKAVIAGVAILAFAGAAHAATDTVLNLYGTSEENNLWAASAGLGPVLLTNSFGCTTTHVYSYSDSSTNTKSNVVVGAGCTSGTDSGYIFLTYTNKASWDGINAVNGEYDPNNWGYYDSLGVFHAGVNPCGAGNPHQRPVGTVTCTGNASSCTPVTGSGLPTGYSCQAVQIGVSNLEASAVIQSSNGDLTGPIASGKYATRSFPAGGPSINNIDISLTNAPLAYPFSFYVNPGVKSYRCNSSSPTASSFNNLCVDDKDCGGTTSGGHTYCTAQTIDNLSRLQIVALFSGGIADWNDFGAYYPSKPVTLCMRHAGAGTHSVLDLGIMEGNGWGASLAQYENRANTGVPPYIYFNDLQADEQNCLRWADGLTYTNGDAFATNQESGAIGYVDADTQPPSGCTATTPPTVGTGCFYPIKYNGVQANRITMHDGVYDNFWTVDHMYAAQGLTTNQKAVYNAMMTLVANPTNINSTTAVTYYKYYGSANELNFPRTNGTFAYPYTYSPCTGTNCANPN